MIDHRFRVAKDRIVEPVVARLPGVVTAGQLTLLSLLVGVGAGVLAAGGWRWWSLAAWLTGRALDGLDGAMARRRGRQSDLGGYLDQLADTVAYAAVPLGIAAAQHDSRVWAACTVLLASFYVNAVSWTYLAAVAERRGVGATARGERTTIHMPPGLVEGAETIVLFSLMLAVPGQADVLFSVMAVLVALTIVQRIEWAWRSLR